MQPQAPKSAWAQEMQAREAWLQHHKGPTPPQAPAVCPERRTSPAGERKQAAEYACQEEGGSPLKPPPPPAGALLGKIKGPLPRATRENAPAVALPTPLQAPAGEKKSGRRMRAPKGGGWSLPEPPDAGASMGPKNQGVTPPCHSGARLGLPGDAGQAGPPFTV
ncbi:hypothetical protein NDU88_004057 [Pleurodeles waltl]|uniref:Uncharacterized protein n=1 Tax=Pleurodeles waltl TaxID=8319 RepID=A0AAV7KYT1_PLEWA|nr:hypothetical protein NDU88_004057 [Pleurodeles waltl]